MINNNKNTKRRILIVIDMLTCVLCSFLMCLLFNATGYFSECKLSVIVLSVICLPFSMVLAMVITKSYKFSIRRNTIRHFYRYMVAIMIGLLLYICHDILFLYNKVILFKLISALLSGCAMISARLIYYKLASREKSEKQLNSSEKISDIAELFLGKDKSEMNDEQAKRFFQGKCILITGAGGFIGSHLVKKICTYECKKVILVDIYENNLAILRKKLDSYVENKVIIEIASVQDYKKMDTIFEKYKPDIVYHAAAHKHVTLMEDNPEEAVKNNIFGTYTCAKLADIYRVDRFVLISSDKAINAVGIMGATKRVCELIMRYMTGKSRITKFMTVRFCNVMGSDGSVIPIFEEQINMGGPVTITHKDATRYFMSVDNAISLIIRATLISIGNEIFVLKGGKEINIKELAYSMIKARGLKPNRDIKIKYTGLYSGERLHEEELVGEFETDYKNLYYTRQVEIKEKYFYKKLNLLNVAAKENDRDNVIKILMEILYDYDENSYLTLESVQAVESEKEEIKKDEELFDEAL